MDRSYLTPEEVASALKLSKYTVYEMIKRKELPASKIGRALRILRTDLDHFMRQHKSAPDEEASPYGRAGRESNRKPSAEIYFAGSHDLSLDLLTRALGKRGITLLPVFSGSMDGLIELYKQRVDMAGCHLLDQSTGEYNLTHIRSLLPNEEIAVVNLVNRWQGFIVPLGNPRMITSWEEFLSGRHRIVNRQRGSGTRLLLDCKLRQFGHASESIPGYEHEVSTHYEVASAVLRGDADVALGIESAAKGLGLDFFPVQEERYDLVIPTRLLNQERFRVFLEVLRDPSFKQAVVALGGYGVSSTGKILERL
ncbi:helix-turn-helix domain-containing protein [Brevibacillus ruminantium]|uniref:Helix-turn-helix domain-containing protein n=1 Tax=Brevibacillus ruminantium TaxID=2950604 RepID=A0ABY4WEC9_9BACL|nr:substrate-binding domain-containing protein [Brevibacillus ruminantium]USG64307.1 helix-turn-helix domain-containing protein [Brevibacillus ruminantium]